MDKYLSSFVYPFYILNIYQQLVSIIHFSDTTCRITESLRLEGTSLDIT